MNILVTGVGSTLGFGILRTLKKGDVDAKIFGTDYLDSAVGLYEVEKGYLLPDIYISDNLEQQWLEAVMDIVSKHDIDFLFVGLDFEVPIFAKYKADIERMSDCIVIVSSSEVVRTCNDKWLTYLFLGQD